MKKKSRKVTKEQAQHEGSYERAMRSALSRKPFLKTDGKYPTREEIYDRARMREIDQADDLRAREPSG